MAFLWAGSCDLSFCCRSCPAVLSTITRHLLSVRTPFARLAVIHSANDEKSSDVPTTTPAPFKLSMINQTSFLFLCPLFFLIIHNFLVSENKLGQNTTINFFFFFFAGRGLCICIYLFFIQVTAQQSSKWQPVIKYIRLFFWWLQTAAAQSSHTV